MTSWIRLIAFAVVLLTGCTSTTGTAPTGASPGSSSPAASATAASPPGASDLEGVWRSGVVTPDTAMAALQTAGLGEHGQAFFNFWNIADENQFTLRVGGGRWICFWSKDGGQSIEEDSGAYSIDGDTVTIRHDGGADTLRWSVDGNTLTLAYLSDTFDHPEYPKGEEVYQTILYMSSPWERGER